MALAPPLPADAPRLADGRYVLLTRLGEGGMAVVYGAWDEDLRIWRAVKILLPEFARRPSVRRRFEVEAQTMMAIRHPNLVRVVEVNAQRALPYLVMDLVAGGSIEEWSLRNGAMPPRLAADVAIQVCRGLCAVHEAGVVHRDVKPQNVLAERDGTCKLTDFGVARVEGGDTKTGVSMGTVGYMSPEQLADSKSVDPRTDVYSLGASLYVLLTRAPVRDLFRIADDPSRLDGVPNALRPIVARCLCYEREERYPDIPSLLADLEAAVDELPPVPDGTPPLPRRATDSPPGGSPGEFTELMGLLEAAYPPSARPEGTGRWAPPLPLTPMFAQEPTEIPTTTTEELPVSVVIVAPTPPPVPSRAQDLRPVGSMIGTVLAVALAAMVILGLAVVIAVPVAVGAGSARIEAAARDHAEAERILVDRVDDVDLLLEDLVRIGGRPVDRPSASDDDDGVTFGERVSGAARPHLVHRPDDPELELARQRLQRVVWAVDKLHEADDECRAAAASPTGWLAIAMGLSAGPAE